MANREGLAIEDPPDEVRQTSHVSDEDKPINRAKNPPRLAGHRLERRRKTEHAEQRGGGEEQGEEDSDDHGGN